MDLFVKWPLKITIYDCYQNALDVVKARGRYVKETVTLSGKTPVECRYLLYKEKIGFLNSRVRRTLMHPYEAFVKFDEKKELSLLRIDTNHTYPVEFEAGQSYAVMPEIVSEEEKDAKGKPTGRVINRKTGNMVKQVIFDSTVMIEEAEKDEQGNLRVKFVKVPHAVAHEIDLDQWTGMQLDLNSQKHDFRGTFEKWIPTLAPIIVACVAIIAIYLITQLTVGSLDANTAALKANTAANSGLTEWLTGAFAPKAPPA